MTFRDLVCSAVAGLLQHKFRTLLTLIAVALGAMLLFGSISGALGVIGAIRERLAVGDRLLTIRVSSGLAPPAENLEAEFEKQLPSSVSGDRRRRLARIMAVRSSRGGKSVPLTLQSLPALGKIPGVREITPALSWRADIGGSIDSENVKVSAVRAASGSINSLIVLGRPLSGDSANEALVSEGFLFSKGFKADAAVRELIDRPLSLLRDTPKQSKRLQQILSLRERVRDQPPAGTSPQQQLLNEREISLIKEQLAAIESRRSELAALDLTIVGIYRAPDAGFQADPDLVDAYYNNILIPVDLAVDYRSHFFPGAVVATIKAVDASVAKSVADEVKRRGFHCNSLADVAQRIRGAVLMVSAVITAIAAGAFFIAALGMTNTMVMNVLERRREIGILKSVGARDRDILRMFLTEGLLVGVVGGLTGLSLGLAATGLSGEYLRRLLERQLNEPFVSDLFACPWWLALGTPVVAGLVTVAATIVPARRAAKLDPVETLRVL